MTKYQGIKMIGSQFYHSSAPRELFDSADACAKKFNKSAFEVASEDDMEALRAEARELGVEFSNSIGFKRLNERVEEVRA